MLTRIPALAVILAVLSGCASLTHSGYAEYSVKPMILADRQVCCEVVVKNGKEIGNLKLHVTKKGDDYIVYLKETNIAAFEGQAAVANTTTDIAGNIAEAVVKSITKVP